MRVKIRRWSFRRGEGLDEGSPSPQGLRRDRSVPLGRKHSDPCLDAHAQRPDRKTALICPAPSDGSEVLAPLQASLRW
jgi:hypothetical protein